MSCLCSVAQSRPTLCNPLRHARLPCPSPTPRACSNSCPSSWWCPFNHLTLGCPFLLLPSILPASGSFPISQFFASGGQSIGVSASASVLPMNIQDWFPLGLTSWISLQSKDSQESSSTPQFKSINSSEARSKHLLILWLQSPFAVILEPNKIWEAS